jgi:chemotaxis protein CheC
MNLTADQVDALQEIVNIGVGRAAAMLNQMIQFPILLQIPSVKILSPLEIKLELEKRLGNNTVSAVRIGFGGPFYGSAQVVFPVESASLLVAILTGEELGDPELDSLKVGTLSEVGNILLNGVMGSISNILHERFNYTLPTYTEDTVENLWRFNELDCHSYIILARARFTVEELHIEGDVIVIFKMGSFEDLMKAIAPKAG